MVLCVGGSIVIFPQRLQNHRYLMVGEERNTSEMDNLLLGKETDWRKINSPNSGEFVINAAGSKLHVRTKWPMNAVSNIIIFLHGYASQSNRPTQRYLASQFNTLETAFVTFDFTGHGFSEGQRGLIRSPDVLIDDALSVLLALFGCASIDCELERQLLGDEPVSVFVMGHSMGGGVAILLSHLLSQTQDLPSYFTPFYQQHFDFLRYKIARKFRGAIFICPVVLLSSIPSIIRTYTIGLLASLLPADYLLPSFFFEEVSSMQKSWASAKYRDYISADSYPKNPEGLTYGGNMYLRSLISILELADLVQSVIPALDFPFLVLHAPEDAIVSYQGSLLLLEKTIRIEHERKSLITTPNMLHDIVANDAVNITTLIMNWVGDRSKMNH